MGKSWKIAKRSLFCLLIMGLVLGGLDLKGINIPVAQAGGSTYGGNLLEIANPTDTLKELRFNRSWQYGEQTEFEMKFVADSGTGYFEYRLMDAMNSNYYLVAVAMPGYHPSFPNGYVKL